MELIFLLTSFYFHLLIFRPIWRNALERTTIISTTGTMKSGRINVSQKKMQVRLALTMSITVLEFNIFQLPFTALVLAVVFESVLGKLTIPNEFATVAFCFFWTDSIINPLWTSFISKRTNNNQVNGKIFSTRLASKWNRSTITQQSSK